MSRRRKQARVSRLRLFGLGLRKLELAQRPTPAEARELRRRRLADGSYAMPDLTPADLQPLGVALVDPRTVVR